MSAMKECVDDGVEEGVGKDQAEADEDSNIISLGRRASAVGLLSPRGGRGFLAGWFRRGKGSLVTTPRVNWWCQTGLLWI